MADQQRARVLVVDDDPTIRRIVAAIVRSLGHEVILSHNGRHAWETLQIDDKIDLLVTDVQMPELDGKQLVSRCRADGQLMDLPVIVVSGAVGPREISSLLQLGASRFVAKPVRPARLGEEVKQALAHNHETTKHERLAASALERKSGPLPVIDVEDQTLPPPVELPSDDPESAALPERVIERIADLTVLPSSLQQLIAQVSDPEIEVEAVAKTVASDPVLAAAIIAVANRATAGGHEQVTDIEQAVSRLGLRQVLAVGVKYCLSDETESPVIGYDLEPGSLWKHSLRTAVVAQRLATRLTPAVPVGLAFTAALFHDFGKLLLAPDLQDRDKSVSILNETSAFLSVERRMSGADHAVAGSRLLDAWGLPSEVVDAVRWHHHPAKAPPEHQAAAMVVHLADLVSQSVGDSGGVDSLAYPADGIAEQALVGIDESELEGIVSQSETELMNYGLEA